MKTKKYYLLLLLLLIPNVYAINPCADENIIKALKLLSTLLTIVKIIVPVILIIKAIIIFIKELINSKDELKESITKIFKNIIIGLLIFLLPSILLTIIHVFVHEDNAFSQCSDCLLDTSACNNISSTNSTNKNGSNNTNVITPPPSYVTTVEEFIKKNEGYKECNDKKGYLVIDDNGRPATAYGITGKDAGGTNSLKNCNLISKDLREKYFSDENFVPGLCIPKEVLDSAIGCHISTQKSYITQSIDHWCSDSHNIVFNDNQISALIDIENSGPGYLDKDIQGFCSEYNKSKDYNKAYDALFTEVFKTEKMNPKCSYIARRDCAARLFFEGDTTCGNQNIYDTNYQYKYSKYFDDNYQIVNGICQRIN